MGENGAGKSTMMKCLFGIYAKDEGSISLLGKPINFKNPKEALENGVAMVHQELNQCLDRTVTDNLFLARYPTRAGIVDEAKMLKEANSLFASLLANNTTAAAKATDFIIVFLFIFIFGDSFNDYSSSLSNSSSSTPSSKSSSANP